MKLLLLSTLFLIISCVPTPEMEATSFQVTVSPVVGPDDVLEAREDESIEFEYTIRQTLEDENKKMINLELVLFEGPKHGKLSDCSQSDVLTYKCKYTPDPNYSGADEILFKSRDGDFITEENSKLVINIAEVIDEPHVSDIQVSVLQGETVSFDVPFAQDPDSAAGQILYEIISDVTDGVLSCFKDANGDIAAGVRKCTYTAGTNFYGEQNASYSAKDHTDTPAPAHANIKINVGRVSYSGEEIFSQGQASGLQGVDITWVVDNSGSMGGEQAALQQNVSSFVSNFLDDTNGDGVGDKAKFPFKMIVTSTEAYLSGKAKFFSPAGSAEPYNLTSTFAESDFNAFKTTFEEAVLIGLGGSGSEKALSSADALYMAKSDWYGGNDTISVYIILTDEPEQSTNKTIAEWVAYYQGLKDDPSKTRFYPIINPSKDAGNRYAELAQLTGGTVYSINNPFDQILNDISLEVTNLIDRFSLKQDREIIEDSVMVYINDVPQLTGWKLNNHVIVFDTEPPADAVIKVTYNYYNPGP